MTDNKNGLKDYKNLMTNMNALSNTLDSTINSSVIKAGEITNELSNSLPIGNIKRTGEILTELSNSITNSITIDSLTIESIQEIAKAMNNASNLIPIGNIKKTGEILTQLSNSLTIDSLTTESIQEIGNAVQKIALSIPNFSELISIIDWDEFDLTENDVKKAEEIINNDDIDLVISEELNRKDKETVQPTNPISVIIKFFMIINHFITVLVGVNLSLDLINNTFIPAIEAVASPELKNKIIPMKYTVKKIHDMIKEKIDISLWSFLGIVATKGLNVYKKKRLDSIRKGKLNSAVVIKIIEQDRNWIYISLDDCDGNSILEGWTLTRYIKKIK